MNIEFLSNHAKKLTEFASETELKAKAEPNNFFLQAAAVNQKAAAAAARRELAVATAEASGSLVDFRLIGPRADGSLPLEVFIKAMQPFVNACKYAAHKIRHGTEAAHRVSQDISNALNIKLAGLAPGSTHILMTGNASPDLTGESLFNETLKELFELLNSDNTDFYGSIDAVGGKAAHHVSELMRSLNSAGLAAELSWNGPGGMRRWKGRPDEIIRVRSLIEMVQDPSTFEEVVEGVVAGIRDTGRLHLRTDDGLVSIRYPFKLTKEVQLLKISSPASLSVRTTRYWDEVNKQFVFKRQLISVVV